MKTNIIHSRGCLKNSQLYFFNKRYFLNKKIPDAELLVFFQSICEFFNVYENIIKCIEASLHVINHNRAALINMVNSVKKGVLLSKAFDNSGLFSDTIINIVKAGEKNNDILGSFKLIVDFLNKSKERKNKLINTLFYPVFTLGVFFTTIFMFSRCVIPSLIELVSELNSNFISRFLLVKKILFSLECIFWSVTIISLFFYVIYKYDSDYFERLCIKTPIIKNLFVYSNLYFLSYYMKVSLKNNLSVEEALDVTISSSTYIFKKFLKSVKQDVLKGKELSNCFNSNILIPKMFIDILSTGEKSNNLISSFETTELIFKTKQQNLIDKIIMFTPIFLITFIATLLIIFVSFLLFPLYNLGI